MNKEDYYQFDVKIPLQKELTFFDWRKFNQYLVDTALKFEAGQDIKQPKVKYVLEDITTVNGYPVSKDNIEIYIGDSVIKAPKKDSKFNDREHAFNHVIDNEFKLNGKVIAYVDETIGNTYKLFKGEGSYYLISPTSEPTGER